MFNGFGLGYVCDLSSPILFYVHVFSLVLAIHVRPPSAHLSLLPYEHRAELVRLLNTT
jgi:hypothetical protein